MVTGRKAQATVNDLTKRPRNRMRKSESRSKDVKGGITRLPAEQCGHKSNSLIDATVDFYGTWLEISEQVTLQAQDPRKAIVA